MNAKHIPLRSNVANRVSQKALAVAQGSADGARDSAPDEAQGEDTPGVLRQAQDGKHSRTMSPRELHLLILNLKD